MNINSNELLILKKIKFAAEPTEENNTNVALKLRDNENQNPEATTSLSETPETTQASMNKLMFQGLKNVVSDPQLAQETGALNNVETQPKEDETAKEYVAPFKSNLAFQGGAGKIKSFATAALMGLATLGATSSLTSCIDVDQHAELDASIFASMISELQMLRQEISESNKQMAERFDKVIKMFTDFMDMYKQDQLNANTFRNKVLANQDILIGIMRDNGKTEQEAKEAIEKVLAEVISGNKTVAEGIEELKNLLTDIKVSLSTLIKNLEEYAQQASTERQKLIATNEKGFEELIQRGDITNETLKNMQAQNDSMIVLSNKQIEAQEDIKEAIEKANLDSNANFETVIKTLNLNKNDVIRAMMRLGYTMAEIEKMTAGQITAAIDRNTEITKQGNALLARITGQLMILPQLYKENKITNAQLREFMKLYQEATAKGDEFNEEMLAKLDELAAKLDGIQGTLNDMNQTLKNLYSSFNSYYDDYKADHKQINKALEQIIRDQKFNNAILLNMSKRLKNMDKNLEGIKANTDSLLVIAKDDTKHKELVDAIKNIKVDGGVSADIDYERFEAMFEALGLKIDQVAEMSQAELIKAINDFKKDVIEKEEENNKILQQIYDKINGIDWENPDYSTQLAKIIELIENFKCNCDCGGSNEGIIGDLNEILNTMPSGAKARMHASTLNKMQNKTYFAPQWAQYYGFDNRA